MRPRAANVGWLARSHCRREAATNRYMTDLVPNAGDSSVHGAAERVLLAQLAAELDVTLGPGWRVLRDGTRVDLGPRPLGGPRRQCRRALPADGQGLVYDP